MIEVKKEGIVLSKTNHSFEIDGVLNPATIYYEGYIHMFYRAVAKFNYSSIGYCKLKTPLEVTERFDVPIIFSQYDYEEHGVEDARIVRIEDTFYLSFCAYDGVNALGALATSTDLVNWNKRGIIVPKMMFDEFKCLAETKGKLNEKYLRYNEHDRIRERKGKKVLIWDKNVIFFPRRINGKLHFLHRIKPDIQLVCVKDLDELTTVFWQNYLLHFKDNIVLSPKHKHEISYIGGGCPPIETVYGWLLIYHGVHDSIKGYVYCACAALLDIENPQKELARLPYALFKPDLDWELKGEVNNVCFPTGTVVFGDKLYIYYGAADERIACASVNMNELLTELMLNLK
ncbi:pesticidal protein Cry7Aa [Flavobacterium psychrophilum]|uniref:glycoside hydrolase family 130 protein n=1 Tax=Flavobacterium psychrophilum TaxID=96345 RepID=UPI00090A248F|nr:pesticidal protein Cry7Aa [Flavobacterium psychrophilum]EKT2072610.1 pesticidal protein Cry7Aa [Flavobacterium psychrophilum]EKT4492123.1 pesticidal protein Cry7Aa [Flavobacterium psychrophilum]SHH93191.1 Probable glycosidase, PH1107-related protein [Flavobacterium psychrophilum]